MLRHLLPLLSVLLFAGCMEGEKANPLGRNHNLYDRLGGEPAVSKVVDDFIANMLISPDIRDVHKEHFKGDVTALKRKLIDQIGEATGGPQKYTGKSMVEAHKGLGITPKDFDATVKALEDALKKAKVHERDIKEIKDKLASMKDDIVTKMD